MTIMLDDFPQLIKDVEKLKAEADKAEGAYDQILKRIKKEFGVGTLKEAEALLLKLEDSRTAHLKKYNREYKRFMKKWKKTLRGAKK